MRNQEREREMEQEKAELKKLFEFYKQQEKEEKLQLQEKLRRYGDDLTQQMEYTNMQKEIVNETLMFIICFELLAFNFCVLILRRMKM